MNATLLDSNALIALVVEDHVHHDRVARWVSTTSSFALCATVEGALVRFLVRLGESSSTAQALLAVLHADPRCSYWGDGPSYAEVDLHDVLGHRQVTDGYLVGVATARSSVLATLDRALSELRPGGTLLIPQ